MRVLLPPLIPGESRRFPVVYMTDATGDMIGSDTTLRLLMLSDTPRFVAVGIGYPDAPSYFQTMVVRQRDLAPVPDPGERTDAPFAGTLTPSIRSGGQRSSWSSFAKNSSRSSTRDIPLSQANAPTQATRWAVSSAASPC